MLCCRVDQTCLVRLLQMRLAPEEYEPRLKNALECFRCDLIAKNMPALKKHLQEEFDALRKRGVGAGKSKKRKCVVDADVESASDRETLAVDKAAKKSKREIVNADVEPASDRKGKGKKVARMS
jgi:hypothetical protein